MDQTHLREVLSRFHVWSEKYVLGLTVRQFERLGRCPFCELVNPEKWWEPWPECRVCFGRGRVPSKMVPALLNTIEYKKAVEDDAAHILSRWKRDKRFDARYSEAVPGGDGIISVISADQYN
jgi:hypothetical protein